MAALGTHEGSGVGSGQVAAGQVAAGQVARPRATPVRLVRAQVIDGFRVPLGGCGVPGCGGGVAKLAG